MTLMTAIDVLFVVRANVEVFVRVGDAGGE